MYIAGGAGRKPLLSPWPFWRVAHQISLSGKVVLGYGKYPPLSTCILTLGILTR
jgi:hypothetical protein